MSIPPVSPSGPSGLSGPTTPSAPNTQSVSGQSSYYSSSIASGSTISIIGFSQQVLSATNQANEVVWASQQAATISRNPLYEASIGSILALLNVFNQLENIIGQYASAYTIDNTNLNNLNSSIDSYNAQIASDQAAVNTLNAAINTYNSGVYKTQAERDAALQVLQNATNAYNAYANARNANINQTNAAIASFNSASSALNDNVASINELSSQQGLLGPQPGQDLYGSESNLMPVFSAPPTTTFNNTTSALPDAANTMNATLAAEEPFISAIASFQNLLDLMLNQFALTSKILDKQSSFQAYVQYYLQTNQPFLPAAFITPTPQPALSPGGGGVGSGAGVSLGSIIASLSNPLFEGILAQGIFTANANLQSLIPSQLAAKMQYLNIQLLSQAGLLAGSTALGILKGKLASLDLNSQEASLVVGLAVAQELQFAVGNGVFQKGVQALLAEAFPNLGTADSNQLSSLLAAPFELFALNLAVFQLAQGLSSPLLFGQIFSNLSAAIHLGVVGPQPSITDILNNSASLNGLATAAGANLSISEKSQLESEDIVNQAIAEATANGTFDKLAYINSLQNQGVSSDQAAVSADNAERYLESEIIGYNTLNQSVRSQDILNNSVSQSVLANELVRQIVTNSQDLTYRQLRDQLANEFINHGAANQEALQAATTAVAGPSSASATLQDLAANLHQQSYNQFIQLGFAPQNAQTLSDQLVSVVLGPAIPGSQTSIKEMMDEKLNVVLKLQNDEISEEVKNEMLAFLAPTMELSVFAERLRDPANSILLSALTGITYGGKQPSNFLKNVDINV